MYKDEITGKNAACMNKKISFSCKNITFSVNTLI